MRREETVHIVSEFKYIKLKSIKVFLWTKLLMAAMHYIVMVERSSVKVFFTILVLHIFYFLQSEYIKILQNRKPKNILTYLYM